MTQRFIFLSAMVLAASATASAGLLAAGTPAQENSWTSHGPRGSGLVWDVTTAEAAAFAATTNGVFRSVDGGASWEPYGLARESISQVLTTPGAEVVWATVERAAASAQLYWLLYASRDGGRTWDQVPDLPAIRQAAIDPWHPTTFYAGAGFEGRIWKSTDAGNSWQPVSEFPGVPGHFEFDSVAIYVETDDTRRYYRSSDGGATWAPLVSPLSYVYRLAAGAAPGVVYASGPEGFCRSVDSASTWTCSNAIPGEGVWRILELPGQSPRIIGLSAWSVFATDDLGATWAEIVPELSPYAQLLSLDSDVSGSVVLVGTSDGILRSQDRGGSWAYSNDGIAAVSIRALAPDPGDPSTIWAATGWVGAGMSDPQLFRSEDGGLSWEPAGGPGVMLNGHILTIAPGQPATLYTASGSEVYRSDDSGESWTRSPLSDSGDINALAIDPRSANRVLASTSMSNALFDRGRVHRSEDGGRTWTAAELGQEVHSLLIDGRNPGTVFAGSYYELHPEWGSGIGGSIFVSRDGGATFAKGSFDFGNPVIAILADPTQDGGLYVATSYSNRIFRSVDNGAHWVARGDPEPWIGSIRSLVVDPVRRDRLYAATAFGVYRSVDGARTWLPFSLGLSPLPVHPLAITSDGRWLHVGTRGGGAFSFDLLASQDSCAPSPSRLCLLENRYAVELSAQNREGETRSGVAHALSGGSGYFALDFITGDPELPEVVIKMLPNGTFGWGAPVFYTSLTTRPFTLRITDTLTGQIEEYRNDAAAPLCGGADIAFGDAPAAPSERSGALSSSPGDADLRLLGNRFELSLTARHAGTGRTATGHGVFVNDRFGYFSFPEVTGDAALPEVFVKMLDFRWLNGTFLLFHAGLTGFDYTLTVRDGATGAERTYSGAGNYCGSVESDTFAN